MDLLVITAASVKGTTASGVEIAVKINGQPAELQFNGVELPPAPRPLPVEVTLTPNDSHLFGVTGSFMYLGNGNLLPADAGALPPNFRPVRAAGIEDGSAVMSLIGYVSRVRDVTEQAIDVMISDPDRRLTQRVLTSDGRLEVVSHVRTIGNPPLQGGQLIFDPAEDIDPKADMFVLEVAVEPAPRLLAVTCPRAIIPGEGQNVSIDPPPVLLYFHSMAGQNFPEFYFGSHPFSFDFLHFGLMKYVYYDPTRDPLEGWGAKGMPYQIKRAGAQAIYVLPLNKPGDEVGVMVSAAPAQEILEEVTAWLCRKNKLFIEPGLGRVALGGFSSGNLLVTRLLQKNEGTPFFDNILKEVYNFDIPASKMPEWTQIARKWLNSGDSSDKMLRSYTQQNHPAPFQQLLGSPVPAPPFVVSNATQRVTAACIPGPTWFQLASGQMQGPNDFQTVHQLIAETCLTDAVRRSGFPKAP